MKKSIIILFFLLVCFIFLILAQKSMAENIKLPPIGIDATKGGVNFSWKKFKWFPENDENFKKEVENFFKINESTEPTITLDLETKINNSPTFLFEKESGRAYPNLYTLLPLKAGKYILSFYAKTEVGKKQDVLVAFAHKRDKITISDIFKKYNYAVNIPIDIPEALISFAPLYAGKSWVGGIKLVKIPADKNLLAEKQPVQTGEKAIQKTNFNAPNGAKRKITIGENGEVLIDGKTFFPIGIYTHTMELESAKELGLNLILCFKEGELKPFFEEAQKNNMEIIFENHIDPDKEKLKENLKKIVDEFSGYPNFAWHLVDEPDLKSGYDNFLPLMKEELEKLDPFIPLYTSNHSPETFKEYIKYTDILSMDPYPIATLPRPSYTTGWWLDEAYKYFTPGKSIWVIVQAFPFYPIWREPTPAELRFMTYQAINHKAMGIVFYAVNEILNPKSKDYRWHLKDSPLWDEIKKLSAELKELTPVILSFEKPTIKIKLENKVDLDCNLWSYKGNNYLIAINLSSKEVISKFKILPQKKYRIKEMFVGNAPSLAGSKFQDKFEGYGVKIYEISPVNKIIVLFLPFILTCGII